MAQLKHDLGKKKEKKNKKNTHTQMKQQQKVKMHKDVRA
jgi:hypothetical protein